MESVGVPRVPAALGASVEKMTVQLVLLVEETLRRSAGPRERSSDPTKLTYFVWLAAGIAIECCLASLLQQRLLQRSVNVPLNTRTLLFKAGT